MLISPDGRRLSENQTLSIKRLLGWRGYVPDRGGAVLIRLAKKGGRFGFAVQGEFSFASLMPLIRQALALAGADGSVNLRLASSGAESQRLSIGRYDWQSKRDESVCHLGSGHTKLVAVNLYDHTQKQYAEAEEQIDLFAWLGEIDGLWFIQGRKDGVGVMRPFTWSAQPPDNSTRDERLDIQKANWEGLLDRPGDDGWDAGWALLSTVREVGDAGPLDQVQALARIPEAAVALLMFVPRSDRAAVLALETETPIWWPLIPIQAWGLGLRAGYQRLYEKLTYAGLTETDASKFAEEAIARAASEIVTLRPELAAHIGHGLRTLGLQPEALDATGHINPLLPPGNVAQWFLNDAAQEAGRRFDSLPDGAAGLQAQFLLVPENCNSDNAPLLHAPLVVAEVAAGLRAALEADDILRLIALRESDPVWFDRALPAALTLALQLSEVS